MPSEATIRHSGDNHGLTPELLLRAYAAGIFPMAESRDDPSVFWVDPKVRGVLPFDRFHVPRGVRRVIRRGVYRVTCDAAFEAVIEGCAAPAPGRRDTWINDIILGAYVDLHRLGHAHSIECWLEGDLAGGLYGVALGGAFCGESMFSRASDASKVALVHLMARLRAGRFVLLDTQFVTEHLRRFGAEEIPAREYLKRLDSALSVPARFPARMDQAAVDEAVAAVLAGSV